MFSGKAALSKTIDPNAGDDFLTTFYGSKERFEIFTNFQDEKAMTMEKDLPSLQLGDYKHAVDCGGINGCPYTDSIFRPANRQW